MSGKFEPRDDLEHIIARMIVPEVQAIIDAAEGEIKATAPRTKTWKSSNDAFVREAHRLMDGVTIPENTKFKVPAYQWDVEHPGAVPVERGRRGSHKPYRDAKLAPGHFAYMDEPRDLTAGAYVNTVHCRCRVEYNEGGLGGSVTATKAVAVGPTVHAQIVAEADGILEAEYGDVYPGNRVAEGTGWVRRALSTIRARLARR